MVLMLCVRLSRQAFWICRAETRKHNGQREPPVRGAGPRSTRLRHRQLRLQNNEAVKPPPSSVPFGIFLYVRDVVFFLSFFPFSFSLFLSALLVCLDSLEGTFDVKLEEVCRGAANVTNVEASEGRTGRAGWPVLMLGNG